MVRLVGLTRLPAGARPTATGPEVLKRAPLLPATASVVDRHQVWKVPMSFGAELAWQKAHPPAGLASGEGGQLVDGTTLVEGSETYAASDSPAWTGAALEISVASIGPHESAVRADGVAAWLDPRPYLDDAKGPRLRMTVARGCPATRAGSVGVRNRGPGLADQLLPSGGPTGALVCNYDQRGHLAEHRLLGAAAALHLARYIRSLPLSHVDGAATSCPDDIGTSGLVAFSLRHGADVDLSYGRSGCVTVANGHILTSAPNLNAVLSATR